MKVLITGGAGFIGSHLADKMLEENHEVYVIDNLSTGSRGNINHNFQNPNYHFFEKDVSDYNHLYDLCNKCDIIFHLASSVGVKYIMENQVVGLNSNILSSILIIKIAAELKKRIVIFSSSEIYGKNNTPQLSENDNRILGSSFRWSYAVGKAVAEYYAIAYGKESGLNYIIVRCFNVVGPRQVGNYGMVLPRLVGQALKNEPMTVYDDGTQIRTFTYVKDLVNALNSLIKKQEVKQEIFNLGSDNHISILDLAKKIKTITNSSSPIIFIPTKEVFNKDFEDIKTRIPNTDKLTHLLGNIDFLDIDNIIRKVIDYHLVSAPC